MKENAEYASDRAVPGFQQNRAGRPGALVIAGRALADLKKLHSDIKLHFVGHSAGSILLGAWLDELHRVKLKVATTTLYAPACTLEFAEKTYGKAIDRDQLASANLHIDMMDDERER